MPDYEKVSFLLEVIQRSDQSLQTSHKPLTQQDREVLRSWISGGLVQSSHAFMLEALRREAYLMLLAMMAAKKELVLEELIENVRGQVLRFYIEHGPDVCKDSLERIKKELES